MTSLASKAAGDGLRQGESDFTARRPLAEAPEELPLPRVLVIGAGVVGLTTALRLRQRGYEVTVVADRFAPDLTSVVAGALWEWPPAVCGRHGDPRSLERSKRWCLFSYAKFKELEAAFGAEDTGIHLRQVYFYFDHELEHDPFELGKMEELAAHVDDFERGLEIVDEAVDRTFRGGLRDAYRHMAPMVDTDVYMGWLLEQARARGVVFVKERIAGNLVEIEDDLLARFEASAIVNCAGLGALSISGDSSMYPLRGALVRLVDHDRVLEAAHCMTRINAATPEQSLVFIVPRGREGVVLGGLVQKDRWATGLSLEDPLIRQMYDGCLDFLPLLRTLPLDEAEPVRTGLRPFTRENVCVESVPGCRIVHNYGHGGAGVTLSWGCAEEVAARVEEILRPPSFGLPEAAASPAAETVFILHGTPPFDADFRPLKKGARRLVLLCSRQALAWLVPAQYHHLDAIEVFEKLAPEAVEAACRRLAGDGAARLATLDPGCEGLVADLKARLADLTGDAGNGSPRLEQPAKTAAADGLHYWTVAIFESGCQKYFAAGSYSRNPADFQLGHPVGGRLLGASDFAEAALRRFTGEILAQTAGLHGVYHLQCRMNEGGQPKLLHLAARPPIAPIARMVELCHGIRLNAVHLESQLGGVLEPALLQAGERRHGACAWHPPRPGEVAGIARPETQGELDATWRIYPGMRLAAPVHAGDFAASFVVVHRDGELVGKDAALLESGSCYDLVPAPVVESAVLAG
jgi:glycine/D-amino acid oxidase-like deaminating enzyme